MLTVVEVKELDVIMNHTITFRSDRYEGGFTESVG